MTDQYAFQDPAKQYPKPDDGWELHQAGPGTEQEQHPKPLQHAAAPTRSRRTASPSTVQRSRGAQAPQGEHRPRSAPAKRP